MNVEVLSRFRTPASRRRTFSSGRRTGKVDLLIGTHQLLQKDVQLQRPGPARDRRRAALRRGRTRSSCKRDGAAGRRAHAFGNAHPADAEYGAFRCARHVGHRTAAAGPPARADLCARARLGRAAPTRCAASLPAADRSITCTTASRTSSQYGGRDRASSSARRSPSRIAHGKMSERPAQQRHAADGRRRRAGARLHDDHRDGHRHSEREHPHHRGRRPAGACPAAPDPRARRAQSRAARMRVPDLPRGARC